MCSARLLDVRAIIVLAGELCETDEERRARRLTEVGVDLDVEAVLGLGDRREALGRLAGLVDGGHDVNRLADAVVCHRVEGLDLHVGGDDLLRLAVRRECGDLAVGAHEEEPRTDLDRARADHADHGAQQLLGRILGVLGVRTVVDEEDGLVDEDSELAAEARLHRDAPDVEAAEGQSVLLGLTALEVVLIPGAVELLGDAVARELADRSRQAEQDRGEHAEDLVGHRLRAEVDLGVDGVGGASGVVFEHFDEALGRQAVVIDDKDLAELVVDEETACLGHLDRLHVVLVCFEPQPSVLVHLFASERGDEEEVEGCDDGMGQDAHRKFLVVVGCAGYLLFLLSVITCAKTIIYCESRLMFFAFSEDVSKTCLFLDSD